MFRDIAYQLFLGISIIKWLGIATLIGFTLTGAVSFLNKRGITRIPFVWHTRLAAISFLLALIHAFFGLQLN